MVILARMVGVVIVCMGTVIALNPAVFRRVIDFWSRGNNVYMAGAMRLVFGTIFILAAPQCRFPRVVSILGVLMLIGAAVVFLLGPKRIKYIFDWWQKKPPAVMRVMGLLAISIGALVLYVI
ncbi:MAG: hypothetical protein WC515_04650 [Candidatus Omnitrophota bacterium]